MSGERFTIDTNVLVYAGDAREETKQPLAQAILRRAVSCDCRLTIQAVMEFYAAARKRLGLAPAAAAKEARRHAALFPILVPTQSAMLRALSTAGAGELGHWDALLLATAEESGCKVALSEDMSDGHRLGNIVVRNPFAGDDLSPAARQVLGL
jgi:predicted nucleic acid-binding protein